jgi:hypothetical protein
VKITDATKKELMNVSSLARDGNTLLLKGKIFGAMPMTARLTPEEARAGLKLLSPRLVWFLLTFLFRSSATKSPHQ